MTPELIMEMEDKIMQSLYKALTDGKITTVQGMCDVLDAIYEYMEYHYKQSETIATSKTVDLI